MALKAHVHKLVASSVRADVGGGRAGLARTLDQILAHYDDNRVFPEELIQNYEQLAEEHALGSAPGPIAYLRARNLYAGGRLCESLLIMERALAEEPHNLEMQRRYGLLLRIVCSRIEEIGRASPQEAEFGRTYDHLLLMGQVPFTSHFYAVHHFFLSGQIEKASCIARQFFQVAPNFPGLREMMRALGASGGGADLIQLAGPEPQSSLEPRCLLRPKLDEVARLYRRLELVGRHLDNQEWLPAMQMLDDVLLDREPMGDDPHLDLFYYKGICLDAVGRTLEAFEIFSRLQTLHPENLFYARSLRIVCTSLQQRAWELFIENEDHPHLINYDRILYANYFSPLWLTETIVRIQGDTDEGKKRLCDLQDLSPFDLDYWKASYHAGQRRGDVAWLRALEGRLKEIRQVRPFDPDVFGLKFFSDEE